MSKMNKRKEDNATDNRKSIRIFGVPWHVSHNYSLINIPNTKWYLLNNNIRKWNWDVRELPNNAKFVPYYEPGKYDLAVLHIDQQCIDERIGKGKLYCQLNSVIQDIPKIVINHGTPFWPEVWEQAGSKSWKYPLNLNKENEKKVLNFQVDFLINGGKTIIGDKIVEVEGMRKLIGQNTMVVNSFKARDQWGWGKVIWHGLEVDDWWDLPKEPRSITTLSPGGLDYYYGRDLLSRTITNLKDTYGIKHWHVGHPHSWTIQNHEDIAQLGGFGAYRDFIGKSLIYFNPTIESPMPRSRTEAMLSGACILTTAYQDADKFINFDIRDIWANSTGEKDFIENIEKYLDNEEINGFIVPENPKAISSLINHLICNRYKTAIRIGQKGKEIAQRLFSKSRYDSSWKNLLQDTIVKHKQKKI